MKRLTLKQMLFNLLTNFEKQFCEKSAMQVILEGCPDSYTRQTWKRDVARLVNDPKLRRAAHAVFEPHYAQIEKASDEADVTALLSKWPIAGKPN